LTIQNTTNSISFYQFLTEKNGVFRIDKPFGTLKPFSSLVLTLKFSATEPINYYKRIFCLVENQDGLVFLLSKDSMLISLELYTQIKDGLQRFHLNFYLITKKESKTDCGIMVLNI
jgi:hypothetical protein